ncbi:hypothetical protein ACFY9R_28660 [Streptomyces albidoflavus]|uniref:hypothetical protein n=1 Tax=Streptomyces albidoflavus TaxID=1886 RepID=UPI0033F50FE9
MDLMQHPASTRNNAYNAVGPGLPNLLETGKGIGHHQMPRMVRDEGFTLVVPGDDGAVHVLTLTLSAFS